MRETIIFDDVKDQAEADVITKIRRTNLVSSRYDPEAKRLTLVKNSGCSIFIEQKGTRLKQQKSMSEKVYRDP